MLAHSAPPAREVVRFVLADAGDSLDDSNFERKNADRILMKANTEEELLREGGGVTGQQRVRPHLPQLHHLRRDLFRVVVERRQAIPLLHRMLRHSRALHRHPRGAILPKGRRRARR